jgi:pyruvate/2-oxoglutarate dehydrogenase complex dihydrolipoamide acyltransferase (E2) component
MNKPFDATIPVLTEVMDDNPPAAEPAATNTPLAAAAPVAAPASLAAAAAASAPLAAPAAAMPAAPASTDWQQVERNVTERVLQQLQGRVDFVLEQRIKDSMAEVLDRALQQLTVEIRNGLHDTIGQIVSRAVQQEITHLQARQSGRDEKR